MSKVMTYYIRSVDRTRILGTIAAKRIEGNRLAFALVIANPEDSSPSRKHGREGAAARLEIVLSEWARGNKCIRRNDHGRDDVIGGVAEVHQIVPALAETVFYNVSGAIPEWLIRRDPENIHFIWSYLELFAKIRNDVEKACK